ncbi:hypothetical protein [Streptomyces collinus]|uniref:hypothetical protein n=1 Tax=Streptomyces collinus TaxID=42684 RepID=UPI0036A1835C
MNVSEIDALTDEQAIAVLALVLDHDRRLPDLARARQLDAQIGEAAGEPVEVDGTAGPGVVAVDGAVAPGGLVRDTLRYLIAEQTEVAPVVERAIAMTRQGMGAPSRFDPVTVGVGALVVLVLQTDVQLERTTAGKWRFKVHKKALSDSALGKLLGKLIATYTGGGGQ